MTAADPSGIQAAVAIIGLAGVAAVLSHRLSERLRVPAPALFLFAAAATSNLLPTLARVPLATAQNVVTVALAVILFDGGLHLGWRRFRSVAVASTMLGVVGTLATAGALAVAAHAIFAFDWRLALLVGAALSPTDPATVFSVLGRREVGGRSGVILEGESGVNDPVGIALLIPLLGATGSVGTAALHVATVFLTELAVGAVLGILGGRAMLVLMRRVPLPNDSLYALRVSAGVLAIYGLTEVAHGSGFLAVFIAGILIGDERAPYKPEIARFHGSLASLAEIVVFGLLGLTINLRTPTLDGAWRVGLVLAVLLTVAARPLLVGLLSLPLRLTGGERVFVLWTGLRGAVPILLGTFVVRSAITDAGRAYEIIFVVVAFSVVVQGSLVPAVARRCGVPLRAVNPRPWGLGVRLRHEPERLHRLRVADGSPAVGVAVRDLPRGEGTWVGFLVRDGGLAAARPETRLAAGDEIVVLADPADVPGLQRLFTATSDRGRGSRRPRHGAPGTGDDRRSLDTGGTDSGAGGRQGR